MQTQGMEGVVAGDSAITWIDGDQGELRYRGYAVGDLAAHCTFEQGAYLIWHGDLPSEVELRRLQNSLSDERVGSRDLLDLLQRVPKTAHPLDVLRYVVSADSLQNPLAWDNSLEANTTKAVQFTAWFPVVVAAFHRLRVGESPIAPREGESMAADFLYMLRGEAPSSIATDTLDASLTLHADHEFNASTFAARVTIATQSNLHAAVASALGTLSGPRHGGASDRVIHMLEDIGSADRVEHWAHDQLSRKQRVMGYGHRVYRTIDPRSHDLRRMAVSLLQGGRHEQWMDILDGLSEVMKRERGLYPNVDLYAAIVNHELGIDPAFYTSIFACSRVVGWTAHAIEQLDGRMIRPVAQYNGSEPRELPALQLA